MIDLAYLSAKTGDEFALLRGKHEDILVHGTRTRCYFTGELEERLKKHKYKLICHSHPGEETPVSSLDDRVMLRTIEQEKSCIISARTGKTTSFSAHDYET